MFLNNNFSLNPNKTRFSLVNRSRALVTGIVVNKKLNVQKEYLKLTKLLIFKIKTNQEQEALSLYLEKRVMIAKAKKNIKDLYEVVLGRLEFIRFVRGDDDRVYNKLAILFREALHANIRFSGREYRKGVIFYVQPLPNKHPTINNVYNFFDNNLKFNYNLNVKKKVLKIKDIIADLVNINPETHKGSVPQVGMRA